MQRKPVHLPYPPRRAAGGALIVSLVVLAVMTLLGLSGMQATSLEERMAGNMRDMNLAFQAAESALRSAEEVLGSAVLPEFDDTGGHYRPTSAPPARWDSVDWKDTGEVFTVSYAGAHLSHVAAAPRYIIEELPATEESGGSLEAGIARTVRLYRVTSRGVGAAETTVAMLQSTFKR
jgi:type IV pilus assembly protein PilX